MLERLLPELLYFLSAAGVVVFSISGALFAAEKKMDILGFVLIGTVTGIGGGTLRDLLLDVPLFWMRDHLAIYLCLGSSALTYFAVSLIRKRDSWILWMDAIGLAVFAVIGTQQALLHQDSAVIAVVMGVMTATFGGIMRDVLCAETLTLMRPEMYITCALLGALVYVLFYQLGINEQATVIAAFCAAFALRGAAILFRLTLPSFGQKY